MSLVILDRDGVINQLPDVAVKRPDELVPIRGSLEAIARLNHAGYRVIIATNQTGIGRKLLDVDALMRIHERLHRQLSEVGGSVDAIFFCPHAPRERCACRKPHPGLLSEIARRLRLPLDNVPAIGDKVSDLRAARAAGALPVLVRTGKGRKAEASGNPVLEGVQVYDDLAAVVDAMLTARRPG